VRRLGAQRTLDIAADIFNVTDRVNFNNPSGDRRLAATFLRPTSLYGGSGFPRQVQIGARFAF
jgi:UDP-glucose 6-dehydrogenase